MKKSTQTLVRPLLFTALVAGFAFAQGCASRYSLKPTADKPEYLNGVALETLVTPKCVVQAGYQDSNSEEMLVRVRVTNKSEGSFDIDPSSFALSGSAEILKDPPLNAQDPDRYIKELTSAAEIHESRMRMESYQGIEELATLQGNRADKAIEAASNDYKRKQEDAESSRRIAEGMRKRLVPLQGVLRKNTVKAGETVEGIVIFKSDFKDDGDIALESTTTACSGKLNFHLKK